VKLVLMGDLHYHDIDASIPEWQEARDALYRTLVDRFLEIDADYHVSLGDLTNYGSTSELEEVYALLQSRDRQFIHVLGNHDLYTQTRREVLEISGQRRYRAIETDDAILVFLDTAREMDYEVWGGMLDNEQLVWLEALVQDSGSKPMLVFAHHPVYATTARSERENGSIHRDIDMRGILLQKQGIGVFFNGHTHVDSIMEEHNWTFVQLSACLDQHAFRIVELAGEEIRISVHELEEDLSSHTSVIYRHIKHFNHNPEARGTDGDRAIVIPLRMAAESQ
jgi:3',5'-cyclic-AMP phosphodiesterase